MNYSIIIPIYNEKKTLKTLLKELKEYNDSGHQIIIINDGSTDGSTEILKKSFFVKTINLKKNYGKGVALRVGLLYSKFNKVIIYDGDLELDIKDITKLMNLNKKKGISSIMGIRSKSFNPLKSSPEWGNFIFTTFFNFLYMSCHKDILCCAKSFYKKDIKIKKLNSTKFDIDIELSLFMTKNNKGKRIIQVPLNYSRRSIIHGKKLKTSDGWSILNRMIIGLMN